MLLDLPDRAPVAFRVCRPPGDCLSTGENYKRRITRAPRGSGQARRAPRRVAPRRTEDLESLDCR